MKWYIDEDGIVRIGLTRRLEKALGCSLPEFVRSMEMCVRLEASS